MMGYFTSIILLSIAFYNKRKARSWFAPESLFFLEWGLLSILTSLRLYTLFEVELKTWIVVLVGSLSFLIGCAFGRKIKTKYDNLSIENKSSGEQVYDGLFSIRTHNILLIILIILTFIDFCQSFSYLRYGFSMYQVREAYFGNLNLEGYVRRTGSIEEYLGFFRQALSMVIIAECVFLFFSDLRKHYLQGIAALSLTILDAFTSGGRLVLAYFIIEIFALNSLQKQKGFYNRLSDKSRKRIVKGLGLAALIIIIILTVMRGSSSVEEILPETANLVLFFIRF